MFESDVPKYKIGCLQPGAVIDNHAFEFYRLAPPGLMLVMVGVGLKEFSRGMSSACSRRSTAISTS